MWNGKYFDAETDIPYIFPVLKLANSRGGVDIEIGYFSLPISHLRGGGSNTSRP